MIMHDRVRACTCACVQLSLRAVCVRTRKHASTCQCVHACVHACVGVYVVQVDAWVGGWKNDWVSGWMRVGGWN